MDLELRVNTLEKKVKDLEQQLEAILEKEKNSQAHLTLATTTPVLQAQEAMEPYSEITKQAKQSAPPKDWEYLIARVWLPRIFIVVFLLGVLWGFTAAVSAGIITEPVRCILGIAVAGFMYWQGEAQIRRSRIALGQVLLGGSSCVLIISLFAAHMLFGLIPAGLAFVLFVVSIGLSVFTALRHRSQALMIITLLAGYLVPFLVDSAKPNIWVFIGYEALFSIAMILVSFRYSFRAAYYVAIGVLHLSLLMGSLMGDGTDNRAAIIIAVILQHTLLYTLATLPSKDNTLGQRMTLFMSFGLLASWMYGLYGHSSDRITYEWMVALWSLLYSGTSYWLFSQKRSLSVHLPIATFGWFLWLIYVLKADQSAAAIVAEGAIALCLGVKLRSKLQKITGTVTYLIGMIIVLVHPIQEIFSVETFAWLALLASIGGLYSFFRVTLEESRGKLELQYILLWAELVLCLIFVTQITNVLTRALTVDYQHLVLSAVWVVYAILLIVYGLTIKKPKARLVGILFLFVTLLKIIFVDLPDVSTAIRAILFIGLGTIGVVISRILYKR
ncbi:DUF2339 domain-containing protein [Paenibacillus sp. N3.4]|uniref:DUF2339 domain-containing protein n=1 Tax=Paenibacillus sp. N3.4 TaxID=2603222 RepID=UPI0011CBBDF3|nr:DUF2339 domain-containing protein [Paenibacillus sp. N3.4]TXK83903.1 DUF2339 domain-containing protein [Paenibacillus sp. N3.4]